MTEIVLSLPPRLTGVQGAAAYTGLGVTTIRRLLREGKLRRHHPVPGRVLVSIEDLDRLIDASGDGPCLRGAHLQAQTMTTA